SEPGSIAKHFWWRRKAGTSIAIVLNHAVMQESTAPRLAKWPFFLGNAFLLFLAWLIFHQGKRPLGSWEILACVVCVGLGSALSIWPYVLEYRSAEKLLETAALT